MLSTANLNALDETGIGFIVGSRTTRAPGNRARAVIAGDKRPKPTRFVTTRKGDQVLDEASLARARRLAGLKGYVTNMHTRLMDASEAVPSHHELWQLEQSFADEQARPASPPGLPPHPRCHRGPPRDGDGRSSCCGS